MERTDVKPELVREELMKSLNTVEMVKNMSEGTFRDISNREILWCIFAEEVARHVDEYTVPQYGDFPEDQMTSTTAEDIKHDMLRYLNRMDSNARGEKEVDRDLVKLAHYAGSLWLKRMGFEEEFKKLIDEGVMDDDAARDTDTEGNDDTAGSEVPAEASSN